MPQLMESTRYDLPTAILHKREEMIKNGMDFGLSDKRTLKCSQQLDDLLNQYTFEEQIGLRVDVSLYEKYQMNLLTCCN